MSVTQEEYHDCDNKDPAPQKDKTGNHFPTDDENFDLYESKLIELEELKRHLEESIAKLQQSMESYQQAEKKMKEKPARMIREAETESEGGSEDPSPSLRDVLDARFSEDTLQGNHYDQEKYGRSTEKALNRENQKNDS